MLTRTMLTRCASRDRVRMSTLYEGNETHNEHKLDSAIKSFNSSCAKQKITWKEVDDSLENLQQIDDDKTEKLVKFIHVSTKGFLLPQFCGRSTMILVVRVLVRRCTSTPSSLDHIDV